MKASFKLHILLISVLLFTGSYIYSQKYSEKDSTKYDRLSDSIAKYIDSDIRLTIKFAKEQLSLAEKDKDTTKIIMALHHIGRNSQFINEYNQSTDYFDRELELIRKIDIHEYSLLEKDKRYREIEILAQLGQNYEALGQYNKAFKHYDECVDIAETLEYDFYEAIMPTIIADLYTTMGNYKEALKKHKESFIALKSTKGIDENTRLYNRAIISTFISETYLNLNQIDSAFWILQEAQRENLDTVDLSVKLSFQTQTGRVYLQKNEYNKALIHLKEADRMAYQYDSIFAPGLVSLELGECYFKLKNYDKAIKTLEKGIRIKKLKTKEIHLTEDYKLLAKIYKEAGNIEKSNVYYEKYIINQTALEKSKDTITSTFHDKEIQNLTKEKSYQKNRLLYVISGISVLVLGLFFVIFYLIKERKKNAKKFKDLMAKMNVDNHAELEIVDTKDRVLEEKSSAEVNRETTDQILNGLEKLKEQEYFLKQECNSYNVAKKIKTNTSYLSKVINSHFQKNFNTYINDLRINYAIVQLKQSSRFRSFSIQSIAEELGYKSADSFTKYFKLRTGLNPSFYIKQLNSLS